MSGEDAILTGFNGLARAQSSLPVSWYQDPSQHEREVEAIWRSCWLPLCRSADIAAPRGFHARAVAGRNIIVLRRTDGGLAAFHNVCRHRGAEICRQGSGSLAGQHLVCPYHQWTYDLGGRLVATGRARKVDGFQRDDHGLVPVGVAEWGGFVFGNPAGGDQAAFDAALGAELAPLSSWPLGDLVVAHQEVREIDCNWKVFWENFNECLHCPGIHPALSDLVPIYRRAIMVREDDPDWRAHADDEAPCFTGRLREGAETWAEDGVAQGPPFPGLTEDEVRRGHTYAVALPGLFVVGHVDHVRAVRVLPLGPERMELAADWLLPPGRAETEGFDLGRITRFAAKVMAEDAAACEMNQRGLRAAPFATGTLMQEEYEVHAFHRWVRARLGEGTAAGSRAARRESRSS